MGRDKKRAGHGVGHGVGPGGHAKERHKKSQRHQSLGVPAQTVLNARPEVPSLKSKHLSYYELVENKDKKKKLEFEITSSRNPPPGFEFVPIGNPELTTACKEISREQDAMIFIVSTNRAADAGTLSHQINRVGHHIRQTIVEEARKAVGDSDDSSDDLDASGLPEPIPETQEEINEQADKAIRDLFPRIPHTDRQMIIEHSFKKGATKKGGPLVGLAQDITLSRRVQLAVLAHIRHTHTRYDKLLKETSYVNARRAVEALCLDVLVKWRGDEETGRDQLDEILREVIVISDSEGEEDDDEDYGSDSSGVESGDLVEEPSRPRIPLETHHPMPAASQIRMVPELAVELRHPHEEQPYLQWHDGSIPNPPRTYHAPVYAREVPGVKRARRGFKRYQAALAARWDEARDRVRLQEDEPLRHVVSAAEYQPYTSYELLRQEQTSSAGAIFPGDLRDISYHRIGDEYIAHPLELSTRAPISAFQATAPHRSLSGVLSRSNSPYTDAHRKLPTQRALVKSGEAQDYLVPSIEPVSPSTEPRPFSAAPVFVRTVSPHQAPRPPGDFPEEAPGQFGARHSPSWGGGGTAPFKRRRVLDNEIRHFPGSPHQEPGQYHQPVRDERRIPPAVHYAEEYANEITPQTFLEKDPHVRFAYPPVRPFVGIPVSAPESRVYNSHGAEPSTREEHAGPIFLENWVRKASPDVAAHPARDYRGHIPSERREETRHPYVIEELPPAPIEHYHPPNHRDRAPFITYQPLHNGVPSGPRHRLESSETYGRQSPITDNANMMPLGYHLPPYSAPRPQHCEENLEPLPLFIRQVEPVDQLPLAAGHRQLDQQYSRHAVHDFQAPRRIDDVWVQPQGQDLGPPHIVPLAGPVHYSPYIAERPQPPSNDIVYLHHSEHPSQQYNQPRPLN